jgi:4-hydroxy-tetrahydrodipicolinate synthase
MFQLDSRERYALADRIVSRVTARVPVVACGGFGDTPSDRAEDVRQMAGTGVDAVVFPTCLSAGRDESDAVWQEARDALLAATGAIPLGLYECPVPYKRLLTDGQLADASASGRFVFMKDTSCDAEVLGRRLLILAGSPLRLFNANVTTLLDSLRRGAAGYSSCAANLIPEHFVCLCREFASKPDESEVLHAWLTLVNPALMAAYPRGAKFFLALRGVPIGQTCRVNTPQLTHDQREILRVLHALVCRARNVPGFCPPVNSSHGRA